MGIVKSHIYALLMTLFPATPAWASPSDLDAAFIAAFGHAPPIIRQASLPPTSPGGTFSLAPKRLIWLRGNHYALVISESNRDWCHACAGATAIAYVRRAKGGWVSEHIWPELALTGDWGNPFDYIDVRRYGDAPLLLTISTYRGMDQDCTNVEVVNLAPTAPQDLGNIIGNCAFPRNWEPPLVPHYSFQATITHPRTKNALFSITYRGWVISQAPILARPPGHPPVLGKTGPTLWFSFSSEAILKSDKLALSPPVRLPSF